MNTDTPMSDDPTFPISPGQRLAGWLVHFFTATGAVLGLLCLDAINRPDFKVALWLMGVAILVDAADGTLARLVRIKAAVPQIDGALLDNLIDYLNYVVVPAFFMIAAELLPEGWRFFGASLMVFVSAYQFTQIDAKTEDHFFKGFPSYWNIAVLYLYLWQTSAWTNLAVVLVLSALVFVPIKYVYPSRLDYLTRNPALRKAMTAATLIWGFTMAVALWVYPYTNWLIRFLTIGYVILYVGVSIYRTLRPLEAPPAPSAEG